MESAGKENRKDAYMYLNEFHVTLPSLICNASQVRISLFTVFADHFTVVKWIFPAKVRRTFVLEMMQ